MAIDSAWRTLTSFSAPVRLETTNASEANDGPACTDTAPLDFSWPSVVSGCG